MNESVLYRHTLEQMTPVQLETLVSMQEGDWWASYDHGIWVRLALEERGLIREFYEVAKQAIAEGRLATYEDYFTEYGRGFLAWYRQPHDTPQQLSLFEEQGNG